MASTEAVLSHVAILSSAMQHHLCTQCKKPFLLFEGAVCLTDGLLLLRYFTHTVHKRL